MVHKTYGIFGYIEYTAEIAVGKAHLSIHFDKGSVNAHGTYPATYTSKNPIEQAIIENSPLFKQERIKFIRATEVADEEEPVAVSEEAPAVQEEVAPVVEEAVATTASTGEAKKFSTLADAKEYLVSQGVSVDGIRLKPDAIEIAKANGLNIEFTR